MNWFLNNREIIKNIAFNTSTSSTPTWTPICVMSEIELTTDFETTDFYVFCDAIQRTLVTGTALSLDCTVKLDINNVAIQGLLTKINSLLTTGDVAQFNSQTIQFELLTGIDSTDNTLEYQKYSAPVTLIFSDLGGAAEEEGEFSLEIHFNGVATAVTP